MADALQYEMATGRVKDFIRLDAPDLKHIESLFYFSTLIFCLLLRRV